MSSTDNTMFVFGWPVTIEPVNKEETRYDEKTGKPHTIQVDAYERRVIVNNTVLAIKDHDDLCDEVKVKALELTIQDYPSGEGSKACFIGIIKTIAYDHSWTEVRPLTKAERTKLDKVSEIVNSKPKMYLIGYTS